METVPDTIMVITWVYIAIFITALFWALMNEKSVAVDDNSMLFIGFLMVIIDTIAIMYLLYYLEKCTTTQLRIFHSSSARISRTYTVTDPVECEICMVDKRDFYKCRNERCCANMCVDCRSELINNVCPFCTIDYIEIW
jgi:hypothetical protein